MKLIVPSLEPKAPLVGVKMSQQAQDFCAAAKIPVDMAQEHETLEDCILWNATALQIDKIRTLFHSSYSHDNSFEDNLHLAVNIPNRLISLMLLLESTFERYQGGFNPEAYGKTPASTYLYA